MTKQFNIGIIGATGAVGSTVLSILEERNFPINRLYPLASHRSAGDTLDFKGKPYLISDIAEFDFTQTDICFFCAGNEVSKEYIPIAAKKGNVAIDKSSYFRTDPDVPLIVPEVNPDAIKDYKKKNIIANPNCSTIPIVMMLKPLYDAVGITRVNVATYQSVSGSGKDGITELSEQTIALLSGQSIKPKIYAQQIAFNVIPFIDALQENGYTKEEMKVVWETQKILNDADIKINPTAVRVPVFYGHSAAVHIETDKKLSAKKAIELLKKAPGIKLMQGKFPYPTPAVDATADDSVYVGRVREDISSEKGLDLWVVADNLRKGAALNAVQIAELLIQNSDIGK